MTCYWILMYALILLGNALLCGSATSAPSVITSGRCVICLDVSRSVAAPLDSGLARVRDVILSLETTLTWQITVIPVHGEVGYRELTAYSILESPLELSFDRIAQDEYRRQRSQKSAACAAAVRAYVAQLDSADLQRTCFLTAIDYASREFLQKIQSHERALLVVIGDLIEECSYTALDMRCRPTSLDSLPIVACRTIGPNALTNVEVRPYILLSTYKNTRWLSRKAITEAWATTLRMLGTSAVLGPKVR